MKTWWIGAIVAVALVAGCSSEEPTTGANEPATSGATTAPNAPEGVSGGTAASSTAGPMKVDEKEFKELPGGLKYAVLKEGTGATAGHQQVSVHYTGWLTNGTKFDSSVDRGQPFEFALGHGDVIKGWDEGVKGMKVGEKRQLVVPASMGYGPGGTPDGTIPPNSTLIFEVELLKVGEAHAH